MRFVLVVAVLVAALAASSSFAAISFDFAKMAPPVASVVGPGGGCGGGCATCKHGCNNARGAFTEDRFTEMDATFTRFVNAFTASPIDCDDMAQAFTSDVRFSNTSNYDEATGFAAMHGREAFYQNCLHNWFRRVHFEFQQPLVDRQFFNQSLVGFGMDEFRMRSDSGCGDVLPIAYVMEFDKNYQIRSLRLNYDVDKHFAPILDQCFNGQDV